MNDRVGIPRDNSMPERVLWATEGENNRDQKRQASGMSVAMAVPKGKTLQNINYRGSSALYAR